MPFLAGRFAIELHKLCIVYITAESTFNRFKVGFVAVTG